MEVRALGAIQVEHLGPAGCLTLPGTPDPGGGGLLALEQVPAKRREADGVQEHRQECNMERARPECRVQKDRAEQVWYQEKPRRRSA